MAPKRFDSEETHTRRKRKRGTRGIVKLTGVTNSTAPLFNNTIDPDEQQSHLHRDYWFEELGSPGTKLYYGLTSRNKVVASIFCNTSKRPPNHIGHLSRDGTYISASQSLRWTPTTPVLFGLRMYGRDNERQVREMFDAWSRTDHGFPVSIYQQHRTEEAFATPVLRSLEDKGVTFHEGDCFDTCDFWVLPRVLEPGTVLVEDFGHSRLPPRKHGVPPPSRDIPESPKVGTNLVRIPYREVRLALDSELGRGAFGVVYQATYAHRLVAAKVFEVPVGEAGEARRSEALNEALCLSKLEDHPNVLSYMGYAEDETHCCILTQLVQGHSLSASLKSPPERDWHSYVNEILLGIVRGMRVIHAAGIVHRDLKPGNIMFRNNAPHTPIICDFGVSVMSGSNGEHPHTTSSGGVIGTVGYMALESLLSPWTFSPSSDVFSFGVVMYEILSREKFWSGSSTPDYAYYLKAGKFPFPDAWDAQVKNVLMECLNSDPTVRPSFSSIEKTFSSPKWQDFLRGSLLTATSF